MNGIKQFVHTFDEALNKLAICKDDILYISSDIKVLLYKLASDYGITSKKDRNIVLNQIVDCLQQIVGIQGTLLFPVFSWSFCCGKGFNYKTTKGEVGSFSNWVMANRPDFLRTQHPMYSFMVWGADTKMLVSMQNQEAWSECSPFNYFRIKCAKQLLFNIEAYQGLTFGHFVEQCVHVPYRHPKYFFGKYTDADGNTEIRSYSMYVRDIDVDVGCSIYNKFLIKKGTAIQTEWQDNVLTVVDLAKCFPIIRDDILYNNGENTLRFQNYSFNWKQKQTVPYETGEVPKLFKR
jgi:aminoglycoside 3-N-acetyltransferase